MPHKHTRKPGARNDSDFNLAPTSQAKPLPAFTGVTKWDKKPIKGKKQNGKTGPDNKKRKRKSTATSDYKEDDTPRAFARLMQFHTTGKRRPSGLDDNRDADRKAAKANKKRKIQHDTEEAAVQQQQQQVDELKSTSAIPKIQPGEKLSDYAARVDQALPVSGLERKGKGIKVDGLKERQTKTEKRLQKMYAEWRKDEARLKEKEEEAREEEEEEEEERRAKWGEDYDGGGESRRGKKRSVVGEVSGGGAGGAGDEEDPWAILKKKRKLAEAAAAEAEKKAEAAAEQTQPRKKGLKGVHDVVLAPPELKVVPTEKFKVRRNDGAGVRADVENVPGKAGSLRRREELGLARREVIERYRGLMKGREEGGG